ncbi:MAG: hypothetical protein Q9227_006458 [Pyrenula ochraceoflavens]
MVVWNDEVKAKVSLIYMFSHFVGQPISLAIQLFTALVKSMDGSPNYNRLAQLMNEMGVAKAINHQITAIKKSANNPETREVSKKENGPATPSTPRGKRKSKKDEVPVKEESNGNGSSEENDASDESPKKKSKMSTEFPSKVEVKSETG